jgi:hypothetical protein
MYDYYSSEYDYYAPSKDERMWAMLCHLSAMSVYIGIPFGNILGPLVVWLLKRDESSFVDEHGKEAINFHISMSIYVFFASILCVILIGIPILFALIISSFVFMVIAAVRANDGNAYQYPMTMRFFR